MLCKLVDFGTGHSFAEYQKAEKSVFGRENEVARSDMNSLADFSTMMTLGSVASVRL